MILQVLIGTLLLPIAKMNIDASRIGAKRTSTISYSCRGSMSCILFSTENIENHHILVTETLASREAIVAIIQKQLTEVIIESDSLIVIQSIKGEIAPANQIRNLVEKIKMLAKVIKNTKFVYC